LFSGQNCPAAQVTALMLVHNHPSGHPETSRAEIQRTQRLHDGLALVDIRTLDHLLGECRDIMYERFRTQF